MKYFVLKPSSKRANDPYAQASRIAMRAYAKHIEQVNPEFADEIRSWADRETNLSVAMETEIYEKGS